MSENITIADANGFPECSEENKYTMGVDGRFYAYSASDGLGHECWPGSVLRMVKLANYMERQIQTGEIIDPILPIDRAGRELR